MINNIVFLKPILIHREWGKNDLAQFGYREEGKDAGELILLSDSEDNPNQIINSNSIYDDISFLYRHNKKFFNTKNGTIPIEIKIINPNIDLDLLLSVDAKNSKYYSSTGCEIVQNKLMISLNKNKQTIICSHKCNSQKTIDDFLQSLDHKYFNELELNYLDAIVIYPNVINQIKQNNIIYQITCKNGLEINLFEEYYYGVKQNTLDYLNNSSNKLIGYSPVPIVAKDNNFIADNQYYKTQIINHVGLENYTFQIGVITHIFVVEGEGKINNFNISTGSNFIVKNNTEVQILGVLKMIVTHIFDR